MADAMIEGLVNEMGDDYAVRGLGTAANYGHGHSLGA